MLDMSFADENGHPYEESIQLALRRHVKSTAYQSLLLREPGNEWWNAMVAFTVRTLLNEDPDFVDLDELRNQMVSFVQCLQGRRDALQGHPWTRFPRDLAYNGHLAEMTAGEAKVYIALLALCDPRTLVTCASLDTIAEMGGRSWHTVSKNLTRLKKRGLIRRWCIRHPNARDEYHYLWFTKMVPEACCETAEDENRLRRTPALPT